MRLATLRNGTRDGALAVIHHDGQTFAPGHSAAPTLQAALDGWERAEPRLREIASALESGALTGEPLEGRALAAPLPRAYEWIDGAAYLNHVKLLCKAREKEPPATLETEPLVYQGGSGVLQGPTDDIPLVDPSWGLDFEAEVCVVLGDTPMGTTRDEAGRYVRLVMLANDVSLRTIISEEMAKGYGLVQGKPATAFSPFAITPDELGDAWSDGRVHHRLFTALNGAVVGNPHAGTEMHFSFFELIEHVCRTRSLTAGTILGGGTVSNEDRARGVSCLVERRTAELIDHGKARTPWMKPGDTVEIEMLDRTGRNLFGSLRQKVVAWKKA